MTHTNDGEHPVVVGVDGSESALHAVRWAAGEAEAGARGFANTLNGSGLPVGRTVAAVLEQ